MADAFYLPAGRDPGGAEVFESTPHTVGPWEPGAQHGGPPSALLGRALLAVPGDTGPDATLTRITVELLGPVPVGALRVDARRVRGGRRVDYVEAALTPAGRTGADRPVALARGWRLAPTDSSAAETPDPAPTPPLPEASAAGAPPWPGGYLRAVEWRYVHGGLGEPGPSTVWARPKVALVDGEPTGAVATVLTVADSGNGVSAFLDPARWLFINTELTVHFIRRPDGDWVCLDARTAVGTHGSGLATSVLHDRLGPVARGAQSLLVAPRPVNG